jgi:hypothetical protein
MILATVGSDISRLILGMTGKTLDAEVKLVSLMYDFRIDQIDAWGPNVEMWETILKDHYPDVHLVYQADEPGCEIHINTDTKGEYFPDKYLLDISLSYKSPAKVPPGLTDGSNFFQTFDDLKKSVEVLTKRKFSNFIEIRNYIMDQTFDGYDFIGVYEYEGCCS